ncbi:MAG: hypothetical protein U1E26_12810 [Coriobacteriia bacterium]|nr:hypothetical protein [Coriobacteriia bacterium]
MLSGLTATAIIASATTFYSEINTVVLVVVGFSVALLVAGWAISKFRRG